MKTAKKNILTEMVERLQGDKVVWLITVLLILISIVCIFSSTSRLLTGDMDRVDIVKKQLFIVSLGFVFIILIYNIRDINFFRKISWGGFPFSMLLLLLLISKVDLPFLKSIELNGARRILQIPGMQIHVNEVIKVAMVVYFAWAMDEMKHDRIQWLNVSRGWKKVLLIYLPFILTFTLVLPGSNTAALFIGFIMFVTILLGGGSFKDLSLIILCGALILGACTGIYFMTKDSEHPAMVRIGTGVSRIFDETDYEAIFLDPQTSALDKQDAIDKIRQPYGAMMALSEGGIIGKGPGQSDMRYFVPALAEDYMFSFIIEEYGLLGGIIVIMLYVSLLARSSVITRFCSDEDIYSRLVVAGLSVTIASQAFLHMFVNVDVGPMTGQTLPLISHGNSAFICFCVAFGLILTISRSANKETMKQERASEPLMPEYKVEDILEDLDYTESNEL